MQIAVPFALKRGLRRDPTNFAVYGVDISLDSRKEARCPQCNTKAHRNDIRFLYTKNLRALDTSERDRALSELVTERKLRRKAEQELCEQRAKYQLLQAELILLRNEFQIARHFACPSGLDRTAEESTSQRTPSQGDSYRGIYELIKSLPLSSAGNCRVVSSCDYLNALCVSQPSTNPIFRGFGIRKINSVEQRPLKYIHLHSQPIRDIAFHPDAQDGILCSASLDKSVRLTSLLMDQVVQTYQCPAPVWSCCWASPEPHRLFAGCSNGAVLVFDVRITSGPLTTLTVPDNTAPVIGLQYLSPTRDQSDCPGRGLLVGQLTKVTFLSEDDGNSSPDERRSPPISDAPDTHASTSGHQSPDLFGTNSNPPIPHLFAQNLAYHPHSLSLEGSLASLSLVPGTCRFLASYRPTQRLPRVRHVLAQLRADQSVEPDGTQSTTYTCNEVQNLWGGSRMKMLTRTRLFTGLGSATELTVVAGSEDAGGALVWRCDSGALIQTLKPPDSSSESPIIDVCPYTTTQSNTNHLALLTERTLHLYRWNTHVVNMVA
ncbi:E3 ubiquitin-protein ligase RFWD3 [Fasciola gigantica]|uniref:RING-type E3 ubiquitin transferase n=1 Tax=Fasciola gigantica TaxID=46835 RepID=A0A504ZCH2_FASGI|nr:E3 ubiquitin-protein ligase RFWD3 [Fasciola gigantica]